MYVPNATQCHHYIHISYIRLCKNASRPGSVLHNRKLSQNVTDGLVKVYEYFIIPAPYRGIEN